MNADLIENIKSLITGSDIKVVSFDIFDTLLLRTVRQPEDVFEYVGRSADRENLLPPCIAYADFKYIRCRMEEVARVKKERIWGTREVELGEIYKEMPYILTGSGRLMELEVEKEKEACYVNPQVLALIEYLLNCGMAIILVSDMYLSRKAVCEILSYNGFPVERMKEIFISSEYGVNKKEGRLYKAVIEKCKVKPEEILHIGDNYASDIVSARRSGLITYHYDVISGKNFAGLDMEELVEGKLMPKLYTLRKLAVSRCTSSHCEEKDWFALGASILGPVVTLFAEWVLDVAKAEGIHNIFPLMREGKFLGELLQNAQASRRKEVKIAPLYISRKAVLLPALDVFDEQAINDILHAPKRSVDEIFDLLGIPEDICNFEDVRHVRSEKFLIVPYGKGDLFTAIKHFLEKPAVQKKIQSNIDLEKNTLIGYLKQEQQEESFLTVDIGYQGTIQKGMEKVYKKNGLYKNQAIKHLLMLCNGSKMLENLLPDTEGEVIQPDFEGFLGTYGDEKSLLMSVVDRNNRSLELLFLCDSGTTVGYTKRGDRYVPVLKSSSAEEAGQQRKIRQCQMGMIAFQEEYLKVKGKKKITEEKYPIEEMLRILYRMLAKPSFKEAHMLGNLQYDENNGTEYVDLVCNPVHVEQIKKWGRIKWQSTVDYTNVQWIEGLYAQADPGYFLENAASNLGYNEYYALRLVREILNNGETKAVIIAAGAVGQMVCKYAVVCGIAIEAYIDNYLAGQLECLHDIPIKSFSDSFHSQCYIIASIPYRKELKEQAYKVLHGSEARIYD